MRPPQSISHRTQPAGGRIPILLLIAACAAMPLRGQDTLPSRDDGSAPYTLHLYARLVELPTLIFIPGDNPPTLTAQQIVINLRSVELKSTQSFHPASVRLQGNDPLSIAILLDVSGDQTKLLSGIRKGFSAWVAQSLRSQDHVSLYTLDCKLIRTSNDVPADPSLLQNDLDSALSSPLPHRSADQPSCAKSIPLSGSILAVMRELSQLPGRRVLLVVTNGRDGTTSITWPQLSSAANLDSVTVFALSTHGPMETQVMRDLYSFTQQSGGLLYSPPTAGELPHDLNQIISQLRGRYILQFPMPHDKTNAHYGVAVTVPGFNAAILPSSISVAHRNPAFDQPSTDIPSSVPPTPAAAQPATPPPATPNR